MGCYIWYSEEAIGRALSPPRPLLAVPNVTAHPSTASVSITVLLYNGPLLYGFNVGIKWLSHVSVIELGCLSLAVSFYGLHVCVFCVLSSELCVYDYYKNTKLLIIQNYRYMPSHPQQY